MLTEPSIATEEINEVNEEFNANMFIYNLIKNYKLDIKSISLENYSKADVSCEIIYLTTTLKNNLKTALEAYVNNAPEEIEEAVNKYNRAVDTLSTIDEKIQAGGEKVVKVNNVKIWEMFHVNGVFQKDALPAVINETNNLHDIVDNLERYLRNLISNKRKNSLGVTNYQLMFNRRVEMNNDSFSIKQRPFTRPKVNESRKIGAAIGTVVSIGTAMVLRFFKIPFGGFVGMGMGAGATAVASKLLADDERVSKSDLNTLHLLANKVESLDKVVKRLTKIVDDCDKCISANEIDQATYANVVTTVNKLINHITEITMCFGIAFSKIK